MNPFDHVTVLLSFVYALALTHLLTRMGSLLVARKRVIFSGLLCLAMANAILFVYFNWLELWDLHAIRDWDIVTISIQFAFAVMVYFVCLLAAPEHTESGGEIDMGEFFRLQHRPYYFALLAAALLSLAGNAAYLKTPNAGLFLKESVGLLPMFLPIGAALIFSSRAIQWACGIALFLMMAGFTITFSNTLA
jgi:hypothetical protein